MSSVVPGDAAIVKELVAQHDEILGNLLPGLISINVASAKVVLEQAKTRNNITLRGRKKLVKLDSINACSNIAVTIQSTSMFGSLLCCVMKRFKSIASAATYAEEMHKSRRYDTLKTNQFVALLNKVTEFTTIDSYAEVYIRLVATKERILDHGLEYEFGQLLKVFQRIVGSLSSFNLLVDEVKADLYNAAFRVGPELIKSKAQQVICKAAFLAVIAGTLQNFCEKNLKYWCIDSRNHYDLDTVVQTGLAEVDVAKIIDRSKRQLLPKLRKVFPVSR